MPPRGPSSEKRVRVAFVNELDAIGRVSTEPDDDGVFDLRFCLDNLVGKAHRWRDVGAGQVGGDQPLDLPNYSKLPPEGKKMAVAQVAQSVMVHELHHLIQLAFEPEKVEAATSTIESATTRMRLIMVAGALTSFFAYSLNPIVGFGLIGLTKLGLELNEAAPRRQIQDIELDAYRTQKQYLRNPSHSPLRVSFEQSA